MLMCDAVLRLKFCVDSYDPIYKEICNLEYETPDHFRYGIYVKDEGIKYPKKYKGNEHNEKLLRHNLEKYYKVLHEFIEVKELRVNDDALEVYKALKKIFK